MMNVASTLGAPRIGMRISGQCVSVSPAEWNSRNNGTIVTSLGISRPTRMTRNNAFEPRKRMRANAHPASDDTASVPTVTTAAM